MDEHSKFVSLLCFFVDIRKEITHTLHSKYYIMTMDTQNVKTPLPIGESFFDKVIEDGYYYVDKTLFIKDLLDKKAAVTLCTRPRRFGKTLNQMMLKCFFEDTAPIGGKDTRALFKGLKIENSGDRYMEHQGKYPVVFLSFKGAKKDTFERSYGSLRGQLSDEYKRHRYVLEKMSDNRDRELFEKLADSKATREEYELSLKFLTKCLEEYHGKKAIVLIDEYDVPLENAWVRGFYQEMIDFVRSMLTEALKDNTHLQFSVITGCLRVSKESVFTGLNNLMTISILNKEYSEYFGFTQSEVDALLEYYGLGDKLGIVREWYNGYQFGNTEVYNPWSSICATQSWITYINELPKSYWVNTSSNDIVRKLIDTATPEMKSDLEILMGGGAVSKIIHEDVTYDEIENDPDNFWNFLFFTGYLKKVGEESVDSRGRIIIEMKIPNKEVDIIFEDKIKEWFKDQMKTQDLTALFGAIVGGDAQTIQNELTMLLSESISYMDSAENFYHGFLAGVLSQRPKGYVVKSNRETGGGRSDLVLRTVNPIGGKAIIFEVKPAEVNDKDDPNVKLREACVSALKQIEDKNYAAELILDGYPEIIKYGIGFYRKRCEVMKDGGQ